MWPWLLLWDYDPWGWHSLVRWRSVHGMAWYRAM